MTRLLLVAAALVLLLACVGVGAGATWHVHPGEGTPIQDAIDGAGVGDMIYVHAGEYVENLVVRKSLALVGENRSTTVIDADGSADIIRVRADGCTISGFTIVGADDCEWAEKTLVTGEVWDIGGGFALTPLQIDVDGDKVWLSFTKDGREYDSEVPSVGDAYTFIDYTNEDVPVILCYVVGVFRGAESSLVQLKYVLFGDLISGSDTGVFVEETTGLWPIAGIRLDYSDNNIVTDNEIRLCNRGIRLRSSDNNILTANMASDNNCGIYMDDSSNNTLTSNTMSENTHNFEVSGSRLSDYAQNIDTSNTVDGKPIYYWVNQNDGQIPSDAGFVVVVNGTNITVTDLTLTNNGGGVLFVCTENSRIENVTASNNYRGIHMSSSSNNNTLANNNCSNNYRGIHLSSSSNNTLTGNTANSNNYCGIWLYYSSGNMLVSNTASSNNYRGIHLWHLSNNNTLANNNCSNNWRGIGLRSSSGNTIYYNNLIDNADHNAYDSGTNQWDSGSEGNYYSDYTGTAPYPIPGGNSVDRYPLMHPWSDTPPKKGDLNGDDRITPADAAIALRIAATGAHDPAADVSGDDCVTSLDAPMILQAAAGRIEL